MDEAEAFDSGHNVGPGFGETGSEQTQINGGGVRGDIDTSAPFESVKEAVNRFGGVGFWKPHHKHNHASENYIEDQTVQLANDLMVKERETLEVLKELEATKIIVEELKVKLQKQSTKVKLKVNNRIKENDENALEPQLMNPSSAPGFILMELKQAKLNLTKTRNDLADISETIEIYNKKIEKERFELEKTRQRLSSNSSKKLNFNESVDFSREIHKLTFETEEFKKVGSIAKFKVLKATNQINENKRKLKVNEIRLIAFRKSTEASKGSEALSRSIIKSISKSQTLSEYEDVTLSFKEYSSLKSKSREADESFIRKVNESMVKVNESEKSNMGILNKLEEAQEEMKNRKRVLEEASRRVESANTDKLKAEEALRKWRSENSQRRKSTVQNLTKFKNSSCKTNSRLLDVNGAHLGNNGSDPVLRPTMSIGQILSRKLLLNEECLEKNEMKWKVSLAQMLSKPSNDGVKRRSGKRKKFGFGRISFLVTKPSKKKKKRSISSRLSCTDD